jgi:hypothetical protein
VAAVLLLRVLPPSSATIARLGIGGFLEESVSWRGLRPALVQRNFLAATPATPLNPPIVVAFRWIEAARIAEALGDRATVAIFDADPRGFAFLTNPADFVGRDVILIGRPKTFARGLDQVAPYFERIDRFDPIPVTIGDTVLFEAGFAVGRRLKKPYPLPYPKR